MINSGRIPAGSLRIVARAARLKEVTGPAPSPMPWAASSRVAAAVPTSMYGPGLAGEKPWLCTWER